MRSSLTFRAPGQIPSHDSRAPKQLCTSSIAVLAATGSATCIAYSRTMTAELNSCCMKNARWCEGGTTFLIKGARRIQVRADETALALDSRSEERRVGKECR